MFRGIFHYIDKPSFLHRLDPRVKLLLMIPILLLAIASNSIFTLSLIFLFVILLYVSSRIPYYRFKAIITIGLLSSITFFFFGTFFYFGFYNYPDRQLTIWLWIFRPQDAASLPILGSIILGITGGRGIVMCQDGFLWGIVTALKFMIALFSGNWMIMTTKPKEILLALNRLGVPIKLTFVAMTALRFIPLVMEEWYVTLNAQRARGLKFKIIDIKGVLAVLTAILSTMVVNSIRRARILALAMETRAFGANEKKVTFKELKMTRLEIALTTVIGVIIIVTLVFVILYPYHTGYTL